MSGRREMNKAAVKSDWQTMDVPAARASLDYQAVFNPAQAERLGRGLIPREMEDKWFVYFADGWLYLHRSWTGMLVYWLKLEATEAGVRVSESYVNREPQQYGETDLSYDRVMLDFLLRGLVLGERAAFPIRPPDAARGPAGVFQHGVVGRAFPEKQV